MPEQIRLRCMNCGHRFVAEAATAEEKEQARLRRHPLRAIHCPKCNRTDTRRGWD